MRTLLAVFGMLTLLSACGYAPHPKNGKLPCDNGCPDGYVCRADNRCWLTSTPAVDSGADGVPGTGGTGGTAGMNGTTGAGGALGTGGVTGKGGAGGTTTVIIGNGGALGTGGMPDSGLLGTGGIRDAALEGPGVITGTGGIRDAALEGPGVITGTGGIRDAGPDGLGGIRGTGGIIGTGGTTGTGGTAGAAGAVGTGGTAGAAGGSGGTGGTDAGTFVPVNAQSCAGGLLCNGESCCTTINVPGGTFTQGSADTATNGAQPPHQSTVSSFALDKYEVTVGRFRKFVTAYVSNTASAPPDGAGVNPAIAGTGWQSAWNASLPATQAVFMDTSHLNCIATYQTWTNSAGTNENKAINCVDWYEAFAFCIWDGGRLATESEWEYAAAGGSENRLYPWGATAPDCTYANFLTGSAYCGPGGTEAVAAVGSYVAGNGKWGHADLAGNVFEWAFDWYAAYSGSASTNYANISSGSLRVLRSGGFINGAGTLRAAYRISIAPVGPIYDFGLRCSRSAP